MSFDLTFEETQSFKTVKSWFKKDLGDFPALFALPRSMAIPMDMGETVDFMHVIKFNLSCLSLSVRTALLAQSILDKHSESTRAKEWVQSVVRPDDWKPVFADAWQLDQRKSFMLTDLLKRIPTLPVMYDGRRKKIKNNHTLAKCAKIALKKVPLGFNGHLDIYSVSKESMDTLSNIRQNPGIRKRFKVIHACEKHLFAKDSLPQKGETKQRPGGCFGLTREIYGSFMVINSLLYATDGDFHAVEEPILFLPNVTDQICHEWVSSGSNHRCCYLCSRKGVSPSEEMISNAHIRKKIRQLEDENITQWLKALDVRMLALVAAVGPRILRRVRSVLPAYFPIFKGLMALLSIFILEKSKFEEVKRSKDEVLRRFKDTSCMSMSGICSVFDVFARRFKANDEYIVDWKERYSSEKMHFVKDNRLNSKRILKKMSSKLRRIEKKLYKNSMQHKMAHISRMGNIRNKGLLWGGWGRNHTKQRLAVGTLI